MRPLVSIVLPTYNQARYLTEALNSVFSQTYSNYELIVVNDGSTDETAEILAGYRAEHEFLLIETQNQGLAKALNLGFQAARGEYLTWTSSDNFMLPEMVAVLVESLERDASIGLVYADHSLMNEWGHDIGRFEAPDYDPLLLLHSNLVHCCFLYRRECAERLGGFSQDFEYGEDWEYWIRLSRHWLMKRVPKILYRYRIHESSMTAELLQTDHSLDRYGIFASRIRRRMPMRWWLGKLKWWWLRFGSRHHSAVAADIAWKRSVSLKPGDAGNRASG